MCGGSIEILPCSVVGHVFPEHSFYDRRSVVPNTIRTVDVWLDKVSRKFFYQRNVDGKCAAKKKKSIIIYSATAARYIIGSG